MNKSEAIKRLDALEIEARALREIIVAPEPPASLLEYPEPQSGTAYWMITNEGVADVRRFGTAQQCALQIEPYTGGNIFTNREDAVAYGMAFDTLLLLHHQPGTVPATGETQYTLEARGASGSSTVTVEAIARVDLTSKMNRNVPMFKDAASARQALQTVGQNRILHMMRTFQGDKNVPSKD